MKNPTTWEQAAEAEVKDMSPWVVDDWIDAALQFTKDSFADPTKTTWFRVTMDNAAAQLVKNTAHSTSNHTYVEAAVKQLVLETLVSKQSDYGHGNINAFGMRGVYVRLSDKLNRLKNLDRHGLQARHETIEDTLVDIIGYCVIGIMLEDGTFNLPLERDLERSTDPLPEHRHDPVYAATATPSTAAGCAIYPQPFKVKQSVVPVVFPKITTTYDPNLPAGLIIVYSDNTTEDWTV